MKRLLLFSLLLIPIFLIIPNPLYAQTNLELKEVKTARSFAPGNSPAQTLEDSIGRIYSLTRGKIIIHSGAVSETIFPKKLSKTANAFALANNQTLFIGGKGHLGFLRENNKTNRWEYQNLSIFLPDTLVHRFNCINVFVKNHLTYFLSRNSPYIFVWNRILQRFHIKKVASPHKLFQTSQGIWLADLKKGLFLFNSEGRRQKVISNKKFKRFQTPVALMDWDSTHFLSVNRKGNLYLIDTEKYKFKEISCLFRDKLKKSSLNGGIALSDQTFLLATENMGFFHFDRDGVLLEHLTEKEGLLSNNVCDLYEDSEGNIWITQNSGLQLWKKNTRMGMLDHNAGIRGIINAVSNQRGQIFLSTSQGVYSTDSRTDKRLQFKPVGIRYPSQAVLQTPYGTIYSADKTYLVSSKEVQSLPITSHQFNFFSQVSHNGEEFLVAAGDGRIGFFKLIEQKWSFLGVTRLLPFTLKKIKAISHGPSIQIWTCSQNSDIYFAKLKPTRTKIRKLKLSKGRALFSQLAPNSQLLWSDNTVYFWNKRALYKYLPGKMKLTLQKKISSLSEQQTKPHILQNNQTFHFAIIADKKMKIVDKDNQVVALLHPNEFRSVKNDHFFYYNSLQKKQHLLFSNTSGFLLNTEKPLRTLNLHHKLTIKTLIAQNDTIALNNTQEHLIFPAEDNNLTFFLCYADFNHPRKSKLYANLEGYSRKWEKVDENLQLHYHNVKSGDYTLKLKVVNENGIESPIRYLSFSIQPPIYLSPSAFIVYIIFFALSVLLAVKIHSKHLIKEKIKLEKLVEKKTAVLTEQHYLLKKKKHKLELANREITSSNKEILSSLTYAAYLQDAFLPSLESFKSVFYDQFIMYIPKHEVSGDFYWHCAQGDKHYVAVADCTGHGVPGAFMSVIGHHLLEVLIRVEGVEGVDQILEKMDVKLEQKMNQHNKSYNDGMDIGLCCIHKTKHTIEFAGARIDLMRFEKGEMKLVRGERRTIGERRKNSTPFVKHTISYDTPTNFYMYTDGFQDQFGGDTGKKFMNKHFRVLLGQVQDYPMEEQEFAINEALECWMKGWDQVDDILVMGFCPRLFTENEKTRQMSELSVP